MIYGSVTKALTADGTVNGVITVDDVNLFYPDALVTLVSPATTTLNLIVVDLISKTQFLVRDLYAPTFTTYKDVSAFKVADGAQVIRPVAAASRAGILSPMINGVALTLDFGSGVDLFPPVPATPYTWCGQKPRERG